MSEKNPVNYYFVLNVSPRASPEEIKRAYLKLVKLYHPDKNRGSRLAEKKFQQINSAWEVLKDSDQRRLFDENLRKARLLKQKQQTRLQSFQKIKTVGAEKEKTKKAIDLEYPLKISLEDLCQSKVKTIQYFKPVNGVQIKSRLKVQIPLGAKQDTRLLFKGKGGSEGKKPFGDLYVKVLIKTHKIFKIIGDSSDLMVEQPISFVSAVQIQKVEVPSPYGFLSLKVEAPIQQEQILKIKGYGLRKNSEAGKGDLFIKFFVEYPVEKGDEIQLKMLKMPYEEQKIYVEQFKNAGFIYSKVLKFQKKIQELKKEYYPNEKA